MERTATILLVDDEEAILHLVEQVLSGAGHRVVTARDGREALDRAASLPGLDLLITDVRLPDVRGTDLAERLRGQHAGLRVLLVSGDPGEAGPGVRFVAKPFSLAEMSRTVREMLAEPGETQPGR